ncbi:MAG: hypothetical protein IT538_10120 [Variibacter sp.]|nr:hypothetical protein [Variibacter sp.]
MMQRTALAAIIALAVTPALGQQAAPQTQGAQQNAPSATAGQPPAAPQAKLRDSLQQAGFKDIRIVDETFVVHARNSDGDMTVMYLNPAAPTGAPGTTTTGPVADRARTALTRSQLQQSLEKAGFKDVTIVGAAYSVEAQTADGGRALMYVSPAVGPATTGQGGQGGSPGQPSQSK